ncbi:MAG TPA: molybdopterin cofactor-binding domain-containing protein [Spirochaetia bacterium]|nr:molybdopterin cofactor-binding domain-containing protein [Spirochaetia bacterium]
MAKQSELPSVWSETGSVARADRVSDWISIASDGTVDVCSGKVELGTGVRTALAQIVADELRVDVKQIRMIMGDTARTPDEGYTAGSKTIQFGGFGLRLAAAEARRALIALAAEILGTPEDHLIATEGSVTVDGDASSTVTYAELAAGKVLDRRINVDGAVAATSDSHAVGRSISRTDLPAKFSGDEAFVHDLRLPGMLHGRVVRPPVPGSRLISLDSSAVEGATVVQLGNFIGVVAEREEQAVRAARTLKPQWEPGEPFPPMDSLYNKLESINSHEQILLSRTAESPRPGASILESVYLQPYQAHASTGPSCSVADYRDGRLTVYSSTQGVFPLRMSLADLLKLPEEHVRVIHREGAGCYGQNGSDDVAADAALLSREAGAPVRVQWSRKDEFAWEPYGPAMIVKMRGSVDARGRVDSWQHEVWTPSHSYRPRAAADLLAAQIIESSAAPARTMYGGGDRNAPTDYRFPDEKVVMHWLDYSPLRVSSLRSLGAYANAFANECFMDELAEAAGKDPLSFRLDHLDDPRSREVMQKAAERAGWGSPLPSGQGLGIAFSRYENNAAYVATVARVAVDGSTGKIRVLRLTCAHDCGRIINPDGLTNQIEGNLIQGASRALIEEVKWEPEGITSIDWKSYPILTFSQVPELDILLIDRPVEKSVGAGEPATITVPAATANAVFAAIGVRLRRTPFTPERVAEALKLRG